MKSFSFLSQLKPELSGLVSKAPQNRKAFLMIGGVAALVIILAFALLKVTSGKTDDAASTTPDGRQIAPNGIVVGAPGAATDLKGTPGKEQGEMILSFTPPKDDAGSAVTNYGVFYSLDKPSGPWSQQWIPGPPYTIKCGADGKSGTCYFYVVAANARGSGPASAVGKGQTA